MKNHWHLHIEKLLYEQQQDVLLEDTHIDLNPDQIYGLMGESGSGKTSLWEALIRYPKVSLQASFSIMKDSQKWKPDGRIALVPQQPAYTLNPVLNVRRALQDVLKANGKEPDSDLEVVLEMSSLKKYHLSKYPHQMSGGELQRVAFALCLCMNAEWLILDEPTASLDKLTASELMHAAIQWKERTGGILIISSHDGHLLSQFCDRIILFENQSLSGPFMKDKVKQQIQYNYQDLRPTQSPVSSNTLISADGIKFSYGKNKSGFQLDVQLGINSRSITGLTGRSGSGKSTLGRILAGYIRDTNAQIRYGKEIDSEFDIQYIPQDAILNFHPYQSMESQLWPVFKKWNPKSKKQDMLEFLNSIQIRRDWLKHSVFELSGGQRQRFLLGRALFSRPKLLILDETFSALDHASVVNYINWLRSIYDEFKTGLVLISHDIRMLRSVCQKIYVMSDGRLIDEIDPGDNKNINTSAVTKALLQSYN